MFGLFTFFFCQKRDPTLVKSHFETRNLENLPFQSHTNSGLGTYQGPKLIPRTVLKSNPTYLLFKKNGAFRLYYWNYPNLELFYLIIQVGSRDGKTYERAKNACVIFFLVWVKSVQNFTLFSRKNELCCNFAH